MTAADMTFPMHFAVLAMVGFLIAVLFACNSVMKLTEGRFTLVSTTLAIGVAYGTFLGISLTSESLDTEVSQYASTEWGLALDPDEASQVRETVDNKEVTINAEHITGPMDVRFSCGAGILAAAALT